MVEKAASYSHGIFKSFIGSPFYSFTLSDEKSDVIIAFDHLHSFFPFKFLQGFSQIPASVVCFVKVI